MLAEYASPYNDTSQTRKRVPTLMNKTVKKLPEAKENTTTSIEIDDAGEGLTNFQPLAYPELSKTPDPAPAPAPKEPSERNAAARFAMQPSQTGPVGDYHQVYSQPPTWNPVKATREPLTPSGTKSGDDRIWERLSYITHLLEEQQNERTENVLEEYLLYVLLGTFVIFVVDSFSRSRHYYTR